MQIIKNMHAKYHWIFLHFTVVVIGTRLYRHEMWSHVCCFLSKKFRNAVCCISYENSIPIGVSLPPISNPTRNSKMSVFPLDALSPHVSFVSSLRMTAEGQSSFKDRRVNHLGQIADPGYYFWAFQW